MCCPNTLQWRCRLCVYVRWMYDTVSCWSYTNSWYVHIVMCLNLKLLLCSIQYEVVISPYVLSKHTIMVMTVVFIFVEFMGRYRIGHGQSDGAFILVCVWIWRFYWCSIHHEVVLSPYDVQTHYNGDDVCACMFVKCMERCHVDHVRLAGTFVLVHLNLTCYSCSMQYEVVISPSLVV